MTDEKTEGSGEQYGLECSKGGDNTFTHGCDVYGGQRHYAMCLKVIGRCNDHTNPMYGYDTNCRKAINSGAQFCPALALRAKEEKVGHSLYYVPREKVGLPSIPKDTIFSQSYERGYRGPANRPPRGPDREIPSMPMGSSLPGSVKRKGAYPSNAKPKVTAPKLDMSNLHGELVNKMLKEEGK